MPRTSKKPNGASLADKASSANGYALEKDGQDVYGRKRKRKRKGDSSIAQTPKPNHQNVQRTFRNITNRTPGDQEPNSNSNSNAIATPAYIQNSKADTSSQTPRNSTTRNPYKERYAPPSSAKPHRHAIDSTHVICAISENLARETCLTTMDAGSPVVLEVNKMGNGQMYAETISFLEMLAPHEILLNEGRKNSQLCQKILALFGEKEVGDENDGAVAGGSAGATATADLAGACTIKTVVKFVPRSYFDQNRGAELLRRIAREGAYDASVVEEYILLSSSYAILQYLQICLGADFARNSLDICMNGGGKNRMAIDRSSIAHLELLGNAKTGKTQNSLIGTIDSTKTTVGSRLLRTNIMSPPTRTDTINARLDLVDTFLEDEQFFYEVLEQLSALPDVEKMLAHMALVPKKRGGKALFGDKRQITARMASKGISALVCIKSALSVVPNFTRVLEVQLTSLTKRDKRQNRGQDGEKDNTKDADASNEDGDEDSQSSQSSISDELSVEEDDGSVTIASSLLLGLGGGPIGPSTTGNRRHQLLRAILAAMKNPLLKEILESTTYSKNSHAMRHQECFALKPNTDGMMVSV